MKIENGRIFWNDTLIGEVGRATIAAGAPMEPHVVLHHVTHQLAPYPGGDFLLPTLSGIVGGERKRGDDAIKSWYSGHLAVQLGIMLTSYDHTILLLEDNELLLDAFTYFDDPAEMYRRWRDDLLTYQEAGVRIYNRADVEESGLLVGHLYARYNSRKHHALDRPRLPQDTHPYRRLLLAVPDWGSVTVSKALASLQTPYRVFTAKPERLRHIATPRRIQSLFETLGRKHGKVQHWLSRQWGTLH